MCVWPQISQPKLGQIVDVGGVLKTSGTADSESVPGFKNWPRFVGVIEQNKIRRTYFHHCSTISAALIRPQLLAPCLGLILKL